MPVILLGALGGMAAAGILGMFVGVAFCAWATVWALERWRTRYPPSYFAHVIGGFHCYRTEITIAA